MNSKIGRPKLPKAEAKSKGLHIRLTKQERKAVDDTAKREGQDTSKWARQILLAAAQK